ncbi:hypothetical protein, partial [Escherichia coli]|jgi:hypothetical protein|uniref:hypothetical protein n=1 Tax=Escherichia coli TaxID=562 RepID=UPI001954E8DC
MKPRPEDATEEERLNPGSEPSRVPHPQPPSPRRPNKAALAGSQNADLKGPKPKRGPRGMST